jgi:ornithine carbamoyltransferase
MLFRNDWHPLQAIADLMTIKEHFSSYAGLTLTWIGDCNNVFKDLSLAAKMAAINVKIAAPKLYQPKKDFISIFNSIEGSGQLEIFERPEDALKGADIVLTDTWISMGQESERSEHL